MIPDSSTARRVGLCVYGLATFLAFPHELWAGRSMDLGLFFGWWVPAALVFALRGRTPREAAREAFLASLVAHYLLFHWFYVVTVTYGGLPGAIGIFAPLVPSLYVSLFTALFAAGWAHLEARAGHASEAPAIVGAPIASERDGARPVSTASVSKRALAGAALWVAVDWLRATFMGGFPWATLGYALHLDVPLLAITRVTGVYGLSFLVVWLGIVAAERAAAASTEARRASSAALGAALVALGFAHVPGALGAGSMRGAGAQVEIAAIQGNIEQGQKWDRARRARILEKYLRLSQDAVDRGAQWVVWPETAVPGLVELDPSLAARLGEFARSNRTPLFVGGMGAQLDASGERIARYFDSAFVIDRLGRVADRYDKIHLVPFGEFVPLRGLLGRFFAALATGLSSADVTAGPRARVLDWSDSAGLGSTPSGAPARVAAPICYELLFPHEMRGFGADGASVMLAMTNDAWYGRTGAPHQFLAMTALRAAENGRFIVRAANTGISAIIDDRGHVQERSRLFEDAVLVASIPMIEGQATFYARFGDVFVGACAAWVGWVAFRMRRERTSTGA